jgi:hypothetical protein
MNTNATGTYEIPCNHVGPDRDYLFFSYIIDLYRPQDGKEIIVCEDGNRIDERVDYDYGKYRMKILRQEIMLSDLF